MLVESGIGLRDERLARIQVLETELQNGTSVKGMNELAALYYAENRVQEALSLFHEVLEIDSQNVEANGYVQVIRGVLDYVNKDLLNP